MHSPNHARPQHSAASQYFRQRRARTLDIRLHLWKRDLQLFRDLLVGHLLEVIQHERNPLVLRELAQSLLNQRMTLAGIDICDDIFRSLVGAANSSSESSSSVLLRNSEKNRQRRRYRDR
jgi:hypothetical protein